MPKRYLFVLGTFFLSVLLYVDRVAISASKERVAYDLDLSEKQMGWVLSTFALGYALFQTPGGLLADRHGPRSVLTAVIALWSLFTALTGAAFDLLSMLAVRFLFGAAEAGAYPACARAVYSWIPMSERGIVQGINFSGARLGAAFALPLVAWMVEQAGWRASFAVLGALGLGFAALWYTWFRDDPSEAPGISPRELERILRERQEASGASQGEARLSAAVLVRSANLWLAAAQYVASNFTFFFCLTWLLPHLEEKYRLGKLEAGFYSAVPFVAGALGQWVAGAVVDLIYRRGFWTASRRAPAILGFTLAAAGLGFGASAESVAGAVACLSLAAFGIDITVSPSWALCIDIGRRHAGTVSGTMNMVGSFGAFFTALAFPYLKEWTGSATPFFFTGALLNALAVVAWLLIRPDLPLGRSLSS